MTPARSRQAVASGRSTEIAAVRGADAEFMSLLRRQCLRAATVGALTAAGESIPGLGRVLGIVFGELVDASVLAELQKELVEQTFAIYGIEFPAAVREPLVRRVQMLGAGASIASDSLIRQIVKRSVGEIGSFIAFRVLPLTTITSSAFSNAMVTYAIGKRAQSVAKLGDTAIHALPDALRAFSGIDERRVLGWTIEATKSSLSLIAGTLRRLIPDIGKPAPDEETPKKPRASRKRRKRKAASD